MIPLLFTSDAVQLECNLYSCKRRLHRSRFTAQYHLARSRVQRLAFSVSAFLSRPSFPSLRPLPSLPCRPIVPKTPCSNHSVVICSVIRSLCTIRCRLIQGHPLRFAKVRLTSLPPSSRYLSEMFHASFRRKAQTIIWASIWIRRSIPDKSRGTAFGLVSSILETLVVLNVT